MQRILRSTAGTIAVELRDSAGALVDATGSVPVAIVDSAGVPVTSGNATHGTVGQYTYIVLPAFTAALDTFTATWTPTVAGVVNTYVTTYETCGGFYFSLTEARAYQNSVLADVGVYPDSLLVAKRQIVEEWFERNLYFAGVPRGYRATIDGTGTRYLELPKTRIRKIVSITEDSVLYNAGALATVVINLDGGYLQRTSGTFSGLNPGNVVVYFEYGYDQPPEPLKEAALDYLRHLVMPTNEDERVLSMTNEVGTMTRYSVPGLKYPTGLPKVDAVLGRYSDRFLHVG